MLYVVIAVLLVFVGWVSTLAFRNLQAEPNDEWQALSQQRVNCQSKLQRFVAAMSADHEIPPAAKCEQETSAEVYAMLVLGHFDKALELAEQEMAAHSADAQVRLLLAHTLLANGELLAAESMRESAAALGESSAYAVYLATRIELLSYLESASEGSKVSPHDLLTPIELLAIELHTKLGDKGDASALWLPGQGGEVPKEEARDFTIAHFSGYYRLLLAMLTTLEQESFGDGLYLLARLAMKCGFSKEGAALMLSIEGAMEQSDQKRNYLRELALLRGERPLANEERSKEGKRIIKLNVLG